MFVNVKALVFSSEAVVTKQGAWRGGAAGFIDAVRSRGLRTALCVSPGFPRAAARRAAESGRFDQVLSSARVKSAGPDGAWYPLAAAALGIHPFNCMVFAGASESVARADTLSMKCIGVGEGEPGAGISEVIGSYDEVDIDCCIEMARIKPVPAEPWAVTESGYQPGRAGFWEGALSLSNGHLGIRGTQQEPCPGENPGVYINGVYETMPTNLGCLDRMDAPDEFQLMVNHPDWRIVRLTVDGERFDLHEGTVLDYRRQLRLDEGVLVRSVRWRSPGGKMLTIETTRLVSMSRRHSAVQRYSVVPENFSGTIALESLVVGGRKTVWTGEGATETLRCGSGGDGTCHYVHYRTVRSGIEAALACGHTFSSAGKKDEGAVEVSWNRNTLRCRVRASAKIGVTQVFDTFVGIHTSLDTEGDLVEEALRSVSTDRAGGFERMYDEQREYWRDFWAGSDVVIEGNDADQQSVRFNLFHLAQSHPDDGRRSIPATGLTGDNYLGWTFWDTEMFMTPFFMYTRPEQVKSLLLYRYHTLAGARRRAQLMLGPGASFPWSTINGLESAVDFLAAYAQYHINSDIAYTIKRYVESTGDRKFLYDQAAEIVFETARFMANVGSFIEERDGKYCVNFVCGPDEYNYAVNNNCYTNTMMQEHLTYAAEVHDLMLKECPDRLEALMKQIGCASTEVAQWRKIAEALYIPFNEKRGIHEQDDAYLYRDPADMSKYPMNYGGYVWRDFSDRDRYLGAGDMPVVLTPLTLGRLQVTKQADVVLLMFLLGNRFPREVKRANYDYYEPRTLHASSLSPAIHSIIAAEIGNEAHAYDYFRQSALMDLYDLKGNTSSGIHLACAGSVWMAVVNGFAGMRDYPAGLSFAPTIPGAWKGYRFKLRYRKRLLEVSVSGKKATFTLREGRALSFAVHGEKVSVSPKKQRAVVGLRV